MIWSKYEPPANEDYEEGAQDATEYFSKPYYLSREGGMIHQTHRNSIDMLPARRYSKYSKDVGKRHILDFRAPIDTNNIKCLNTILLFPTCCLILGV